MKAVASEDDVSDSFSGSKASSPPSWIGRWPYALVIAAAVVRLCFINFESGDYTAFLSRWYDHIKANGHYLAFKDNFSDYPLLYLYILAAATFVPVKKIIAIKLISIIFDYVAAWFVFRIVSLKYGKGYTAAAAACIVLFLPTTVLNSSAWGQCDVLYTSALIGFLYGIFKQRPVPAMVAYGLAVCLKPQALFLAPFVCGLFLSRRISFRQLCIPVLVWLLVPIPAILLGKPLALVFYNQIGKAFGKASGSSAVTGPMPPLTSGAPNFYTWVSEDHYQSFMLGGLILTALLTIALPMSMYLWRKKGNFLETGVQEQLPAAGRPETDSQTVHWGWQQESLLIAALLSTLLVPYFLPGTHERYFYAADLLAIVYVFCFPRFWVVALWIQCASLFSYLPYLFQLRVVSLSFLSLIMGAAVVGVTLHYLSRIRKSRSGPEERMPG